MWCAVRAVPFEFTQMCIDFTALFFAVRFADKKDSAQRTTFIRKKRSGLRMNMLLYLIDEMVLKYPYEEYR